MVLHGTDRCCPSQKATVTATGMCDGSSHEPVIALAGIDLKSACGYAVLSKSGIPPFPTQHRR
jgi:hypothetical protein